MNQYLTLFCLFLASFSLQAQSLRGKIVDMQQQPVGFANVLLLDADSTFLTGNVSDENGTFQIALSTGAVWLKISYIGYHDKIVPIAPSRNDMGEIVLEEESHLLGEVVVRGNLPVTQLKGDALVTTVQNSVLAKVGSANDVLAKVPGILKKKDAYEVFGKGTPLIYINGRQVRNPAELEQLNSDEIKHVEVIANPGSRYDATVKAVIRIQTVKRQGDGFGFDLRSSYYQSQNTDWVEQLHFNYRHDNLDVFGAFDYTHDEGLGYSRIEQENRVDDVWNQTNFMKDTYVSDDLDAIVGLNYLIHENHSLGARYNLTAHPKSFTETSIRSEVRKNGQFYDNWFSFGTKDEEHKPEHQLNIYYNGKVKELTIDFNADYYTKKYKAISFTRESSQEQDDRDIRSLNPVNNQLAAAKLVLSYPLFGGNLSWGSEYTYTLRKDDYLSESADYVPTSYSKIREENISAFAGYDRPLPFGQLSAGIRYEHVAFDYYEDHRHIGQQSRGYDNVYPNVSFATQAGKVQMQLSYTAKTRRPSYRELSNNVFYINRFTLQQGNPSLYPSLVHDVTLSGVWRFLQLTVSYQHKKDEVIPWGKPKSGDPEITIIRPINFDRIPALNTFLSASPTLGCWSPVFSLGISKQWMTVESGDMSVKMNRPMWTGSFDNLISLPGGFVLGVDLSYQSKGNYMNIYSNKDVWGCNVSIRKSFLKDALSIELRGDDIFYKQRNYNVVYFERLKGFQGDRFDTRQFVATVRYKFNATKSKYKGTGAGTREMNRL